MFAVNAPRRTPDNGAKEGCAHLESGAFRVRKVILKRHFFSLFCVRSLLCALLFVDSFCALLIIVVFIGDD